MERPANQQQLIPKNIQRARMQRPFPLNYIVFTERTAFLLRLIARAWIVVATIVLAIMAFRVGIPTTPERGDWDVYAQIVLLVMVFLGAILTLRWEGTGATFIMLAAAGLGALSAAEYTPTRAFLLTLLFFIPSVMFWLVWQRTKPIWEIAVLAVVLTVTLGASGYAANQVYSTYFGPVQPESKVALAPATTVEWIWAGATTDTSVVIKAALVAATPDARLAVSESEDMAAPRYVAPAGDPAASDPTLLTFSVDGLIPDTDYWYAVEAGGSVDLGRQGSLHTFPAGAASFTFAFGACADTGSNGVVFDTIRENEPLFFLHTGDMYYENIAVNDPALYRAAYDESLTAPAQSALHLSMPIAYMWDDHDYGPNDSDSTAPGREAAIATYQQLVPHYPLASGGGDTPIYQAFTVGRVRFIVTDNYADRSPNAALDDSSKTMLGAEQKAWLKQELLDANGVYPVIVWVNSQPWIVEAGTGALGWGAYATERREIADFIVENQIQGLTMLSGDAHMLAIDDGSNNTFASSGGPGFPIFHAAALDRHGSEKGGPYSEGANADGGQFGLVTVNDTGGTNIEIIWSGRNYKNEEVMQYRFTVPAVATDTDGASTPPIANVALTDAILPTENPRVAAARSRRRSRPWSRLYRLEKKQVA